MLDGGIGARPPSSEQTGGGFPMMNSSMRSKSVVGSLLAVLVAAAAAGPSDAQQKASARGNHDWAPKAPAGKHHTLAATLETVQWGWLDPREKPKLSVESGDTVSIETMMHA